MSNKPDTAPNQIDSDPSRRPFILAFGVIALAVAVGTVIFSDLSLIFGIVSGISTSIITLLAWGGENYLDREKQRRAQQSLQAANEIEKLSWQDASTGLFSFSWFQQALEREISRSSRYEQACTMLWLELDAEELRTQSVHAGNLDPAYVWRFVVDLTTAAVRDTDTVARRPGEYSVAILLPQSDMDGGKIVLDRLRERLEIEKLELPGSDSVTAKFRQKIVSFPSDGSSATELMQAIGKNS